MKETHYLRVNEVAVEPMVKSGVTIDGEIPGCTPWKAVVERSCWRTFVPPP